MVPRQAAEDTNTARRVGGREVLAIAVTLAILVIGWVSFAAMRQVWMFDYVGLDFDTYLNAATRWIHGGPFYEPYQLAGSYVIGGPDILYPPVILWLLVPFALGLPVVLWWAVPLGLVGWAVWRLRPASIAWPILAACLVWPPTLIKIVFGNPVIWAWAALAVGVVYVGPAAFALIKPSLAPFAFWGVNRRRWWLCLGIFAALSLPFAPMYLDWLTVLRNSESGAVGGGPFYSVLEAPMMLIPVIAWLARSVPKKDAQDADDRRYVVEQHPVAGVLREGDEVRL